MNEKRYVASLSYGKDSIAMLYAIKELNLPLTDIITVDVWFDSETSADIPEQIEFKNRIDKIIFDEFGIKVKHISGNDGTSRYRTFYDGCFYTPNKVRNGNIDKITGFPGIKVCHWCNELKKIPLTKFQKSLSNDCVQYIGYAFDEKKRKESFMKNKSEDDYVFPLVEMRWTEADCMKLCSEKDMVAPIYSMGAYRDGCWFCPFQNIESLRRIYHSYPDLWQKLLNLDIEISKHPHHSPTEYTVRKSIMQYTKRFEMEDAGLVPKDRKFRWKMIE